MTSTSTGFRPEAPCQTPNIDFFMKPIYNYKSNLLGFQGICQSLYLARPLPWEKRRAEAEKRATAPQFTADATHVYIEGLC